MFVTFLLDVGNMHRFLWESALLIEQTLHSKENDRMEGPGNHRLFLLRERSSLEGSDVVDRKSLLAKICVSIHVSFIILVGTCILVHRKIADIYILGLHPEIALCDLSGLKVWIPHALNDQMCTGKRMNEFHGTLSVWYWNHGLCAWLCVSLRKYLLGLSLVIFQWATLVIPLRYF